MAKPATTHDGCRDVSLNETGPAANGPPCRLRTCCDNTGLLLPQSDPLVWVLIPYYLGSDGQLASGYDTPEVRAELTKAFDALSLRWIWQPITEGDQEAVIERIAFACRRTPGVVVNFCDGCDEAEGDGYPGSSVVELLEAKALPFTGADLDFYRLSLSKIAMKRVLDEAGVPTPPYRCIADPLRDIPGTCTRLGVPLIVKPAISARSLGLTLKSVVGTDAEIRIQVEALMGGRHSLHCRPGTLLVERFVNGREFTVLIVGSSRPGHIRRIFPPLEIAFCPALPEHQRLILPLEEYEQAEPPASEVGEPPQPRSFHRAVGGALAEQLCDISGRAYRVMRGTGYARVDIRLDQATGELFVLEVNANCMLSGDPDEDTGYILRIAGVTFAELIGEIIGGALERGS